MPEVHVSRYGGPDKLLDMSDYVALVDAVKPCRPSTRRQAP